MPVPKLVAFDLDGTLAESKSPVPADVAAGLSALARRTHVAVVTGGSWRQLSSQLLPALSPAGSWWMLPTSGAACLGVTKGGLGWTHLWDLSLDRRRADDAVRVLTSLATTYVGDGHAWGPRVEDRGGQVTLSCLGQLAPAAEKARWAAGPGRTLLPRLLEEARRALPGLDVRLGGLTSVDVSAPGVGKGSALLRLCGYLDVAQGDALYVSDRLEEGGNDRPVLDAGFRCLPTTGPDVTLGVVRGLLAAA